MQRSKSRKDAPVADDAPDQGPRLLTAEGREVVAELFKGTEAEFQVSEVGDGEWVGGAQVFKQMPGGDVADQGPCLVTADGTEVVAELFKGTEAEYKVIIGAREVGAWEGGCRPRHPPTDCLFHNCLMLSSVEYPSPNSQAPVELTAKVQQQQQSCLPMLYTPPSLPLLHTFLSHFDTLACPTGARGADRKGPAAAAVMPPHAV